MKHSARCCDWQDSCLKFASGSQQYGSGLAEIKKLGTETTLERERNVFGRLLKERGWNGGRRFDINYYYHWWARANLKTLPDGLSKLIPLYRCLVGRMGYNLLPNIL